MTTILEYYQMFVKQAEISIRIHDKHKRIPQILQKLLQVLCSVRNLALIVLLLERGLEALSHHLMLSLDSDL